MSSGILEVLGGLGLFLLGRVLMTEGMQELAAESLGRALARFTKNPLSGAATGTVVTALIQSSGVTTVMAIGFVAAGVLTFPQALGVIFGANIGTTITGWLVALFGFQLNFSEIALSLILTGALLRLFGRRRPAAAGYALAGFGLLFVGVALLQRGLQEFQDFVTPEILPADTIVGRALLVIIGVAITLVTQSSSAGVATAITAVNVDAISLSQAGALVIGMDIGTTVTAALAAIGGNVNACRAGIAHVVFNLMTGVGAFLLLPIFVHGWSNLAPARWQADPEIALVGFHSLFNILGVAAALPLTRRFAALIVWLVPSKDRELTRRLEPTLLDQPNVAVESVLATLIDLADVAFASLRSLLAPGPRVSTALDDLDLCEQGVAETRRYLNRIQVTAADGVLFQRNVAALHILDHLSRLIVRGRKEHRLRAVHADQELAELSRELATALTGSLVDVGHRAALHQRLEDVWSQLDRRIEPFRRETIARAAAHPASVDEVIARLDAMRWLRRVCDHCLRIVHHLTPQSPPANQPEAATRSATGAGGTGQPH